MPLSALPALDVAPAFDPFKAQQEVDQFVTNQTVLPAARQSALNDFAEKQTDFGNNQLSQAAVSALAADPEDAPTVWDAQMSKLASQGVPGASQYVGHYRPDLAGKVESAFGAANKTAKNPLTMNSPANLDPAALQNSIAQMPAPQRQQALNNMNLAITGFNGVKDQQSWNDELAKLKAAGLPVDQFTQNSGNWHQDYANAYQAVQKMIPIRDAMQQYETQSAFGVPNVGAPVPLTKLGQGDSLADPTGRIVTTAPVATPKQGYEFIGADKTGNRPVIFNKNTGEYTDPSGNPVPTSEASNAAYQNFAAKMNGSVENTTGNPNAQNPNSSAAGNGQFIDSTWLSSARKAYPQLAKLSDSELLSMRNLPGFSQDMTAANAKQNAGVLQSAGYPVTYATLGMAHQLGAGDVQKVMGSTPNTPMSSLLTPAVMKANPQWQNMTTGQYAQQMAQKLGNDPIPTGSDKDSPFAAGGGKFNNPQNISYTDKDGKEIQTLAQQNKITGQWVSADQNRTPINAPNNDLTMLPSAAGGGRVSGQIIRSLTAAKDSAIDLGNIVALPLSSNTGIFGMRGSHGDGSLMGSAFSVLGNQLTKQSSQDLNTSMVGIGKALAALETGGTAGAGGKALMDQYEKLGVQPGDTQVTAMRKLGAMRQYTINAAEANMSSSFVNPAQKKQFQDVIDTVKKAIPWTPADVTAYERAGQKNPELTFGDFAKQKSLGNANNNKAPVSVQSPADAMKLPSGTPIILPDGRHGTVP